MADDGELLREYSERHSEATFTELVNRHIDMVYSAALRQSGGDSHRAEDVSQTVFADLAQKARMLSGRATVAGWLYIAVKRAAANARRTESRRLAREQKAQIMQELSKLAEPSLDWEKVRPVLDEALGQLNDRDRDAVLLRYFEGCAFAEIGAKLRLSQDAARMRVERALNRLQTLLARRGVTSTGAALAIILANQAVVAAPEGLAAAVSTSALVAPASAGTIPTLIQIMSTTKLQIGIAAAVFVAGAATAVREARTNQDLSAQIGQLTQETASLPQLRSEYVRLRRTEADLRAISATAVLELPPATTAVDAPPIRQNLKPIDSLAAAQAKAPVLEWGAVDQKPIGIDQVAPGYPADLRQTGIGGEAIVDFVIAVDGGVVGAKVISSSNPAFGESALDAVSQWVFKPGRKSGQLANVHMQVPVKFTVSKR